MSDFVFGNVDEPQQQNQRNKYKQDRAMNENNTMNSQPMITHDSQQTENNLLSEREFLGRNSVHLQNGIFSKQDHNEKKFDSFSSPKEEQNTKNEDYENILLVTEAGVTEKKINTQQLQKRVSQIARDLLSVEEQIEIIEDIDTPVNLSTARDNLNQIAVNDQMNTNRLQNNKVMLPSSSGQPLNFQKKGLEKSSAKQIDLDNEPNALGLQLGVVKKAKLKGDDDDQENTIENKQSEVQLPRIISQKSTMSNGLKLWSVVKRDIFLPIKFSGNPHSNFKVLWDIFIGAIILYFPIILPIRIAFGIPNRLFYSMDIVLDLIFFIDMFFSCITGFNQGGDIVKDRYAITKKYLYSTFVCDFVTLIPYYFFELELCYLKILRFVRYWERYLLLLNKTIYLTFKGGKSHKFAVLFYYLFKVTSLILICVHVMSCWWIEVGTVRQYGEPADLPEQFKQIGWVTTYYLNNPNKAQYGSVNKDVYISAYYYVTTTIATVGYGDMASKTVMEELYTMFCEFFGIALFGYISGGLISAVKVSLLVGSQKRNESKTEFDQWLYQREKNREDPLYYSLLKNLRGINHFTSENGYSEFFSSSQCFHYLPKEQKRRIFNLIFTDIATYFGSFFRNIHELQMIQDMFPYLHPLSFLPGAEVIKYRNLSKGLYFIVTGKVYLGTGQEKQRREEEENMRATQRMRKSSAQTEKYHFRKLNPGSFFGEFCLLDKNASFNIVAGGKKTLNVLFITKTKFIDICCKYKETNEWLKKFAYYRFKYFKMEKYNFLKKINILEKSGHKQKSPIKNNQNCQKKSRFSQNKKMKQSQKSEEELNVSQSNQSNQLQNNQEEQEQEQGDDQVIQFADSELSDNFEDDDVNDNQQQLKIQKIESVFVEKQNDLSLQINSAEDKQIIQQIFQKPKWIQPQEQTNQQERIDSNHIKKESILDLIQRNEEQKIQAIPEKIKRYAKSELEFFLQENIYEPTVTTKKNHYRQQSQPIQLSKNHNNLNQLQSPNKNVKHAKHHSAQQINMPSKQMRLQSADTNIQNIQNNEASSSKGEQKRHAYHQSYNIPSKKQQKSSNFQSMQINEFEGDGNINVDHFEGQILDIGIISAQINAHQPYQFNINNRDFNLNILSPPSKENDKLISTPFSSNQQTYTRDTINNQKLLFSDEEQNSLGLNETNNQERNNTQNSQIHNQNKNDEKISQEQSEQFHSCVLEIVSDNLGDQNDVKKNEFEQIQPHNIEQNYNLKMNPNIAQNDKKIDFTQFYQNQNQMVNKEYNQVSVFEKEGEQQGNIQNIIQNGNSNLVKLSELSSGGQNILNKISLTDFQKVQPQQIPKQLQQTQANQFMFPIAEIEEENAHGNRSQGLIKFESIDNISLFIDNEESEEQKRSTDVGYNKQTQENEFIENHQRVVKDDQILDQSEFSEEIRDKIVDLKDIIKQIESSDNEEEDGDDDEGVDDDEINQGDERDNEDDLMDSQEEQDLNDKIQNTHLPLKRKNSVNQIKLIKEEEKKIRRAFRDLTTSNNKLEMLRTQKQMQIAEKVGVKLNYGKQLSSSRLKKQAQHKVMKKILNKKIQILVQTVMGQAPHSSLASKYSQRNSHRLVPQVSQQSEEKPEDLFNSHQFENLMNSSPNDLTPVSQKSSHIQKTQNFLFFKEEPLFRVSQTSESNKKVEIGLCESIYQSSTPKGKQLQSSQRSIMTPRNNQHSEKPKKVGFAMKSKFAKNENDDCDSINQDEEKFQKPRLCDSQMNSDEGDDSKNEAPNILIREMGQEKEKETTDDENASQLSEDNIDQQMNQIYNSRVPNFQLMLYIEKMVSQYKKNYGQSEDIFKTDDYQCYEEIEHNEQQQDYNHLKEQAALDNSMEIPIDIIKPNFDVTELQDLPSYLSNQLQIIENKMQQIIEFTYDESKVCIDRIKKLYQVKQKKLLFARSKIDSAVSQSVEPHRSDSKQNRDLTPKKNANFLNIETNPQMKSSANGLFKNQLNQIQPKLPSKQNDSPQNANLMKEISPGKVNLGYNIKFSFGEENQETGKDDYNFFTELEKKNKIIMQKNQSQFDDASPKICKNSSGKTPKGGTSNKNRYEESLPKGMEAVEEQPQTFSNALQVSSQGKTQKSNLKIQSFNKFGTATMSEQDKIKNEFKKMFSNMRGLHGDSAISLNISDMTNNS